ncbi:MULTISPECIES: hypothetical protein [Haloarcula]|uniref:Uncharacterized protein n=1 Tax=Haloarcula pellucida TaxID=1427151 RepID=A0A830GGY0_9EURY|nr:MULTISPECIES: hypothetical protein [Halomicroarcula]MBX0347019.1 hypothetical protein [Halomicroarcula pellucida]MDS0277106.1 hypothetical protein [Halomicroarcula sp. S1AR25-4]GGN86571.1 hypothetical protein GCM10009030_04410 [Halomicroarcula pellucida]
MRTDVHRSGPRRPLRGLVPALAVVTALVYVAEFVIPVAAYPTWLYVGPLTLPTVALSPTALAVAVLVNRGRRFRAGPFGVGDAAIVVLAALTLLAGVYAVADLNLSSGGVFFSGVWVVVVGAVLTAAVLVGAGRSLLRGGATPE